VGTEKRKKKMMKTEIMANLTLGGRYAERRTTTIFYVTRQLLPVIVVAQRQ